MSQDIPVEIGLDELVQESCYILVVEKRTPFEKIEMVPLGGAGSGCPPFRKVSFRYTVLEELKNNGRKHIGPEIEVGVAHTSMDMDMHQDYYINGVSKSDYRPAYQTKADFASTKLIVFLNSNLEFAVGGAYEAPDCRDKVLEAIGKDGNSAVQEEISDD
jgi:hypothetical protein